MKVKEFQSRNSAALTTEELGAIDDVMSALDDSGTRLAALKELDKRAATLTNTRARLNTLNREKNTLATNLRSVEAELVDLMKEFEEFRCKKCGRVVAEVCA